MVIRTLWDIVVTIRRRKDALGLEWADIAARCGANPHTLSLWTGNKGMNTGILLGALEALGLEMVIREKEDEAWTSCGTR